MSKDQSGLRAILKEITHSPERSTLFWWMLEHHDDLQTAAEGRRLRWAPLCERFAALNLTDAHGKTATQATARSTWVKARRAVVAAQQRRVIADEAATARRKPPSRMSPSWRPQEVVPPPVRVPDRKSGTAVALATPRTDFPTADPSGVPLPPGEVFFMGRAWKLSAAQEMDNFCREGEKIDRDNL